MTALLTNESLAELASAHQPPCLSLYQRTHRSYPENQQDPIQFRNLVKTLETSLRQTYSQDEADHFLEPFATLAEDHDFWGHSLSGLAILSGPNFLQVFQLQRPVSDLAIVADSFHTKPLRRILQSVGRYQVLELSLSTIRLFEGNRDALDQIALAPGVPRTMNDALGDELTEPFSTAASYGGVGQGSMPMHYGHGGRKDETEIDAERFFRAVDHAVMKYHSQPSGLPLILVALPEHHHLFHQVSHNPLLMAEGVAINPDALSTDKLRERAWEVVHPKYLAALAILAEEFAVAKSRDLGSDDLVEVAQAAVAGRVKTLLIESGREIPGRLDSITGQVKFADLTDLQVNDLLDELGELVGEMGGIVQVIPAEQMPGGTGLAAIYRY